MDVFSKLVLHCVFLCCCFFLLRVTSAKNVGTHANRGCFLDVSSPFQRLPENEERRGDVCRRRHREGGDLDRTSGVNAIHVSHRIFRSDRRLSRVHESSRSGIRQHAPPQRRVGFAPHLSTVTLSTRLPFAQWSSAACSALGLETPCAPVVVETCFQVQLRCGRALLHHTATDPMFRCAQMHRGS